MFDGISFWTELSEIARILANERRDDQRVVLVGAGGTAAAIAYWFVREGIDVPITIIGREPTLYARHPSYFEDRLFSDEDAWATLPDHARDEFVRRLTTGVVWDYVLKNLQTARIAYQCADAVSFRTLPGQHGGLYSDVEVIVSPTVAQGTLRSTSMTTQDGAVFVDARGFDRWWFGSLLPPALAGQIRSVDVNDDLSMGTPFPSGLHAPMLASRQGPAAGNLMALGWMSDRIFRAFVPPPTPSVRGGAGGTP